MLSQGEPHDAALNFLLQHVVGGRSEKHPQHQVLQEVDNGTFMYTKEDNLVDADAYGSKASRKDLESRFERMHSRSRI